MIFFIQIPEQANRLSCESHLKFETFVSAIYEIIGELAKYENRRQWNEYFEQTIPISAIEDFIFEFESKLSAFV